MLLPPDLKAFVERVVVLRDALVAFGVGVLLLPADVPGCAQHAADS